MSKYRQSFERRRLRTRHKLKRHAGNKLRLSVHRSRHHVYAQLIDDARACTVLCASTLDRELTLEKPSSVEAAYKVGELIAKRAQQHAIERAVFDRGGFIFHGRVKAVAEGAREAGLKI